MLVALAQAADETSGAYVAGKIVGLIVIALIVVLVVRSLMNKNK